ncbi:hypothetical protein BN1051_00839 [Arthrobacter saudimassiliensis]|uniref:SipW-cognate class signal peptide n=1 Tax=Arthrobacter saudimassiliensis TaxID=1461584 RepID=A0A078MMK3_9MICC|nr:hypothetical protein BN1051_00839 [Arthrobacter saudimassiliensis]
MRIIRTLKAAALVAAAVVLGLLTASGSYALWNVFEPAGYGTVQAADFNVTVNGQPANSTAVPLALDLGQLAPGTASYLEVPLGNYNNAGSPMAVTAALSSGAGPRLAAATPGYQQWVEVRAASVLRPGACAAQAYGAVGAVPPPIRIEQGATGRVCVQVLLKKDAPASLLASAPRLSIPVIVTFDQVPAA